METKGRNCRISANGDRDPFERRRKPAPIGAFLDSLCKTPKQRTGVVLHRGGPGPDQAGQAMSGAAMRKAVGTNVEDQSKLLGGYLRAGTERCTAKLPPGQAGNEALADWNACAAITIGTWCS
jgi:hypothetical protein